ncbi:Predicted phosphohydrolase, MPP superfamily [Geodermatophilus africanus]|uniref:Predicted phosphohydrolase, MPP superfamily n=1 Tax=Geodermatophilus africanus TaxID=1137993 RepID=A0A1H3GR64_9ACTN|nr:metallophosphoesterase [Geodermatophilus africanus]SDY05813.1 Predicted phosphohydrolase, MPP superfamily [Geodermatophilus africanus]
MRPTTVLPAAVLGSATAGIAYASLYERNRWTLRRFDVPVLAPGSAPLRVLHLSDLHMTAGQRSKQEWVASLAELEPDLVVDTGDNLAGMDAVPGTLRALEPLLDLPGVFVMASNDYYAPRPKNPLKYFKRDHERVHGDELPWRDLRDAMAARGWLDLTNARGELVVGGRRIAFAGVDDSHLGRDRYDLVAGPADPAADLRIGLAHSPEPRVLDRFAGDGSDLLLCGHTHGGQLRVPFYGALVTNCGIDRDRVRWLHRWSEPSAASPHGTWLHVSAGLGTSPYAPYRFACPPEATLLTLTARQGSPAATTATARRT